jgi:integrase
LAPSRPLTINVALSWAQSTSTGKQSTAACRLAVIRPFARYMRTIDSRTEVPPPRLLGPTHQRLDPFIYTDEQINILIDEAKRVKPQGRLRPETFATYLGLLASTGMRPPEPLRLTRDDVDLKERVITIRKTKFSKSRIVVLHATAAKALESYSELRDRVIRHQRSAAFFLRDDGAAFTHPNALATFGRLRRRIGWHSFKPTPRLYDIRHTFVCRRLIAWYRQGRDLHLMVPSLSTYLGHTSVTHTYWYVTGVLELMEIASGRFERYHRDQQV